MPLTLVTPPAALPVTLVDAKRHLRVDIDDDDALIQSLIRGTTNLYDGAAGLLGRALVTQTWRLTLAAFADTITLPLPPLLSIGTVTYRDMAGAVQTLAPAAYVVTLGGAQPGSLTPAPDTTWPTTQAHPEAVSITYTAGYGPTAADVPDALRLAMLLCIGDLYANREAQTDRPLTFNATADMLLAPYRTGHFA